MQQLRSQACKVDLVTDLAQESSFRINTGERLILRGLKPLDKQDEGLHTVAVATTMPEIYAFFDARLTEYEAAVHTNICWLLKRVGWFS